MLLNVYTLTSPKLAVLNDSAVLCSNFPHDQIPWSKCISLRLCVFDACLPLHTTRHGVEIRAGLLTGDQARSHAHRSDLTRSLGIQPEVEIDIFCERLREGDSMILCTDGLSDLVRDDELGAIVDQHTAQEGVYHLVDRANENGGFDNITVIVICVLEVGI